MAVVLTIDGSTVIPTKRTLHIEQNLEGRDILTVEILNEDLADIPLTGLEIICTDEVAAKIFAGHIETARTKGAFNKPIDVVSTEITAVDYNALADRQTLTYTVAAGTLKSQLLPWVAVFAVFGITLHGSQADGPTMPVYVAQDVKGSDVLAYFSRTSGWIGKIDYDKKLRFIAIGDVVAPFDIDSVLDNPPNAYEDVSVEPSRQLTRNRVLVKAGGTAPRPINWSAIGFTDDALGKYFGPGITIGDYRTWNLSPLISSIVFGAGTDGLGALKIALTGATVGVFPASLSLLSSLVNDGAGTRYYLERTYDILFDSPVNFWPLNEDAGTTTVDDAGSGADDGTTVGSPTRDALSIQFDGVNDEVNIAGLTAFSTSWSFEAWFMPDSTQSSTIGLIFGQGSSGAGVRYNKTSKKIEVKGDTGAVLAESGVLADGVPIRLAVTVNAGAITIYINGVSVGTGTSWVSTVTPDRIGGETGFFLKGNLRDVAYYPGVAFSPEAWTRHYGRTIDRLMQHVDETALGSTEYIVVRYLGQYPIIAEANDFSAQTADGISVLIEDKPNILTFAAAQAYADSRLTEVSATPKTVPYMTDRTGLLPGQQQYLDVPQRGIDGEFLIIRIEVVDEGHDTLVRHVTASDAPRAPMPPDQEFLSLITNPISSAPTIPFGTPIGTPGGGADCDCCTAVCAGAFVFSGFGGGNFPAEFRNRDGTELVLATPAGFGDGTAVDALVALDNGKYAMSGAIDTPSGDEALVYAADLQSFVGAAITRANYSIAQWGNNWYTYEVGDGVSVNAQCRKRDDTGAVVSSIDLGHFLNAPHCLGINSAETTVYFGQRGAKLVSQRTGGVTTTFIDETANNYLLRDNAILVLPNGDVIIVWHKAGAAGLIRRYTSAGATVTTYVPSASSTNYSPIQITRANKAKTQFAVLYYTSAAGTYSTARLDVFDATSGAVLATIDPEDWTFDFDGPMCVAMANAA